jgi:hypothetical protein
MPCTQEPLNRDSSVNVEVMDAACGEFRNDLGGRPAHLLHNASAHRIQIHRPAAQDHDTLLTIGPDRKGQNRLEGFAAYNERVDAGYELVVAMGFTAARRQKV